MQKTHATISAICKYICTVLAWYLHGTCMVFAWYLHGSCMHMQVPCKSDEPPLSTSRFYTSLYTNKPDLLVVPGAQGRPRRATAGQRPRSASH